MSVSDLSRGQSAVIAAIPEEHLRVQLLRFGIVSGTEVRCRTAIPFGPVVLCYGGQEIALGREIARRISIESRK